MKDKSKFCDTLIQKRLLMMDLSAVNCFCEQLYEHYFSTDGWLPFQYKLWLMGLILRGEKGSRIILNLGEGVLISIVRYSIPKLELRDTTLILSWVMENCPAPILTSCCWTCPTTPLNSPSHHHHIIITSSSSHHIRGRGCFYRSVLRVVIHVVTEKKTQLVSVSVFNS